MSLPPHISVMLDPPTGSNHSETLDEEIESGFDFPAGEDDAE